MYFFLLGFILNPVIIIRCCVREHDLSRLFVLCVICVFSDSVWCWKSGSLFAFCICHFHVSVFPFLFDRYFCYNSCCHEGLISSVLLPMFQEALTLILLHFVQFLVFPIRLSCLSCPLSLGQPIYFYSVFFIFFWPWVFQWVLSFSTAAVTKIEDCLFLLCEITLLWYLNLQFWAV